MSFFKTIVHLLPRAKAWRVTADKRLRQFFEALAVSIGDTIKLFFDLIFLDIFPDTTRFLSKWESQFGLPDLGLSDSERISRLKGEWIFPEYQSPKYIQDTLQAADFDVYVHEWWDPSSEPAVGVKTCVTPRNPLLYIAPEYTGVTLGVDCGEALAQCGEDFAQSGNFQDPEGFLLVNKILRVEPDFTALAGEVLAQCGEDVAQCGAYTQFANRFKKYIVPSDSSKWPYFLYIGGQTFGDQAQVPVSRKNEFETKLLKICPAQQWLGVLVDYV